MSSQCEPREAYPLNLHHSVNRRESTGKVKAFNRNDEQFLEAFVIFCGLGIQNTQMYEAVERAMAKQMVTLEVGCPCRTPQAPCEHSRPTPPCGSARCL